MCTIPNDASAKTNKIDCETQVGYLLHNLLEFYPCEVINTVLSKSLLMAMQSDAFDDMTKAERYQMATVLQSVIEIFSKADEAVYEMC